MLEGDDSPIAIGKRLRWLRRMAGFSRGELAEKAKVGESSITYWERAKSPNSMTPRSMEKVLNAVKTKRLECDERWLLTGLGLPPSIVAPARTSYLSDLEQPIYLRDNQAVLSKLISILDEELKRFTSISELAVITKIDDACMSPIFETGDIVGGLWQASSTLSGEKFCIIELDGKLQVRKVKPAAQEGLFHVTYMQHEVAGKKEAFEITSLPLKRVAPIIRVWR